MFVCNVSLVTDVSSVLPRLWRGIRMNPLLIKVRHGQGVRDEQYISIMETLLPCIL
jgi:hypothetical protein